MTACINITELEDVDPREFFNKRCLRLKDFDTKQFIDFFQTIRQSRYGHIGLLPAEYTHEFNQIKNDWQRKVATVSVAHDTVIIVLKHVQMFQHVYKRLEGLPISMTGNRRNEARVFRAVRKKLCKKFLVNRLESGFVEGEGLMLDSTIETYNYYSNVVRNFAKISANKWMTQKGVNRLLLDPLLTSRQLFEPDDAVERINDAFLRWKRDVEKTKWLSMKFSDAITKHEYWNDPNAKYYLFEYDGFPVGLIVYLIVDDSIGYQLVNKGINHMVFDEDVDVPEYIGKRLGAYMHYMTMMDLHQSRVCDTFSGGAMGTRKASLGVHKMIMNDCSFSVGIYK